MADHPRPPKRPRKESDHPIHLPLQQHISQPPPQPVDHIFIADGLLNKKPGGKKAPLSCCECRRLKLKCDRNFPCASCKKRGCAEICPDGVLVSGKGTRFILANTEQLHAKIQEMSDRIRHLEDSIRSNNSESPLLAPGLLTIKSTMGLYSSNGQLTTTAGQEKDDGNKKSTNGATSDDGQNARADSIMSAEDSAAAMKVDGGGPSCIVKTENSITFDLTSIQADVHRLTQSFPLPSHLQNTPSRNLAMREHIRSQLPSRDEAQRLWDQARRNALWQYNPHPSATFFPLLLHHIYSSPSDSSDETPKPVKDIEPRRLALLLMILSVACMVDVPSSTPITSSSSSSSHPTSRTHSPHLLSSSTIQTTHISSESLATKYHALGRAALCEIPIMEETNVETVLALFYEVWFLSVWSDGKKVVGEAWGIMGLVAKLAQSIGLHRNGGKSKVIPEEVDTRRALFWELLYLDARLSLSLGRPPSLSIHHMDCPRPSYTSTFTPGEHSSLEYGEASHQWQEWKHSCYEQCLVPVLDAISKPGLEYKKVIDLDRSIRDFWIPASLRNKENLSSRMMMMQRTSLGTALEAVLLQLHRSYFIRSLGAPEEAFNRRHKYAPSVVAVFLSASRMIATVHELFQREPELTARILWYWSNAFSATVALCLLVSRAPFTCLSPATLQELERSRLLFRSAKEICPKASQVLPVLETMVDKATDIYNRWSHGQELPTIVLRHITEDGSSGDPDEIMDRRSPSTDSNEDPFLHTHQSLAQCIAEVHQIAKQMFPMRKPCNCANRAGPTTTNGRAGKGGNNSSTMTTPVQSSSPPCPPSHEWSPPPVVNASSPVLPDALPLGMYGRGNGNGGLGVGYPKYNSDGRLGNAYSSSSLKGSGMSPSPSPGGSMYHNPATNGSSGGSAVASMVSPTFVQGNVNNGVAYSGYSNGSGGGSGGRGGMYSPTMTASGSSTHGTPYSQTSSPAFGSTVGTPTSTTHSSNGSGGMGMGIYASVAVMPAAAPTVMIPSHPSKAGVVGTINFDVGALSANNDQSFMVFY